MAVSYSANALFGKAHAMYAERLTQQNYTDMVNCKSVKELFNYLKTRTYFSTVLDVAPAQVTAQQLEELVKVSLFSKIETISRYEMVSGRHFYEYYIIKNDIVQILSVIRLIIIGKPEKYLSQLPAFFQNHTKINLYELANVRDFHQLMEMLDGTPYRKILQKYSDRFTQPDIYVWIEQDFNRMLRETLIASIQSIKGADEKEIGDIIKYQFDVNTIVDIYRFIRLEGADKQFVSNCINRKFTNFKDCEIQSLIESENPRDVYSIMTSSYYKKDIAKIEFNFLEGAAEKMIYKKYLHNFRYSANPTTVMLCYIYLCQTEINNIIKIIEGIKYKIPSNKISATLIGAVGGA